ncbi:MAG: AAA family ATPase [Methyloprofundus sp.]|nr:AAA family ATPase [Methyloprofundus sp.]
MDILEKALEKSGQGQEGNAPQIEDKPVEIVQGIEDIPKKLNTKGPDTNRAVSVDWASLVEQGYLSTEQGDTTCLTEEYRVIKRPLLHNAFGPASKDIERSNLVLITSSIPSEGKTFTAINLAISIANERDKHILLIDADVAKPSIASRLGVTESPGLIEYLEDPSLTFADIALTTDIPNLQIIPAGKWHTLSTELLSSNRMVEFANELSERYSDRLVIFDSPPILAATPAEVLATLVGQVVMVVAAEATTQSIVMDALRKVEDHAIVLALLNRAKYGLSMDYYGYGQYGAKE